MGLTASTYGNYEKDRTPPPQLLVKVADLTGTDLVWLLTGRGSPRPAAGEGEVAAGLSVPLSGEQKALLNRAAELLADHPNNLKALAAFIDLLAQKERVESSLPPDQRPQRRAGPGKGVRNLFCEAPSGPFREKVPDTFSGPPPVTTPFGRWVPVFGRAAAGLARFWQELRREEPAASQAAALDRMIAEASELAETQSHLAVLESANAGDGDDIQVRLVQLPEPITEFGLTEFLDAPALAERGIPMFGLRLSGDSMEPDYPDGAIVLCSPNEPARPGRPAVVRLTGQIGLTCKLYRPRGAMVRLVPANDRYEPQEFPASQLEWALAVLATVQLD